MRGGSKLVRFDVDTNRGGRQPATVVVDEAKLPEFIHEVADPRASCADHLCHVFLIDSGNYRFSSSFLARLSQQ